MDSLSLDTLGVIRDYVGKESYLHFGILSRDFDKLWNDFPKKTRALTKDTTMDFLVYSFNSGLKKSFTILETIAKIGRLDLFILCRAINCPWSRKVSSRAASHGNLDILKWSRLHGCLWDRNVAIQSAKYGHLEVLKWARSQGCATSLRSSPLQNF